MSSDDSHPVMAYPTAAQYNRWMARKDDLGYNHTSQFMQDMIEAGLKKFDAAVAPDETNSELRDQRNDLKDELNQARDRIRDLETRLHHGERATIHRFIEENPGVTFDEIIQHLMGSMPPRVNQHLDDLEGDVLRFEDGEYYPAMDAEGGV